MAHVAVVGGGIGGLACAALCARKGHAVSLWESSAHLGGMARSRPVQGAFLNQGPHALYRGSSGMQVLRSLGISPKGGIPPVEGWLYKAGKVVPMPSGPLSFWTSPALDVPSKMALLPWMTRLFLQLPPPQKTVADWVAPLPPDAQNLVLALIRVSTYTNAPQQMEAAPVALQLRSALSKNVMYLDGGWQQLVDALASVAEASGVKIHVGQRVTRVEEGILWVEEEKVEAEEVVVAVPPPAARPLGVPWPEVSVVRAACLDLLLRRLPLPQKRFVLGMDAPLYFSEHSGVAQMGAHRVVHVARYLAPGEGITGVEAQLEAWMEELQPGWRSELVARFWKGALTVAHALPGQGAPIRIAERLWRVGDGVQTQGLLADASLQSAWEVADALGTR